MKSYYIYIFAVFFLFSCGKNDLSKKKVKKENDIIISAQLAKIKNKFNIAEIKSGKDFSLFVVERGKPTAVLFYSDESAPCVNSKKLFTNTAKSSAKDTLFVQVNLSDNSAKKIGLKYNIFSLPTLVLFDNGKEYNRFVGTESIKQSNTLIK